MPKELEALRLSLDILRHPHCTCDMIDMARRGNGSFRERGNHWMDCPVRIPFNPQDDFRRNYKIPGTTRTR